ncbi:MAG TPA: TRAM domain-containing protein [Actinomycetota bacterium]|nr:TRAM domain-containing protein [Actinomycetota bacterium]
MGGESTSEDRDERSRRTRAPRGAVVELVRLILVAVCTVAGWQIARQVGDRESDLLIGIVLGSAVGYVLGGVIGRRTVVAVSAVEREFRTIPASELLAGVLGLILGLLVGVLISIFLFRLPPAAGYPAAAFLTLSLAYLGYRIGRSRHQELFGLFGLKPKAAGVGPGEVNVLDTSALIDGRILDVIGAGFLGGTFVVSKGVLSELQTIADSSEPKRRQRGQRGLETLQVLQASPTVDVMLAEEPATGDVDADVVRIARDRGGVVVTTDANLAKLATILEVPVRSLAELALAVRPPFLPGEGVTIRLSKPGREHGQGVGYLEDGTMVVVEGGHDHLGSDVEVTVTNVLQTSNGRLVFARMGEP